MSYVYSNFSNGWIVEKIEPEKEQCQSWLLLPAENLWSKELRGFLYIFAMLYMFLGIAIASDVFMSSIEWITSTKRQVVYYDEERGEQVTKEVYVWNETVANLSLMALGSSAPEILLAIVEGCTKLSDIDTGVKKDSLGLFTIIGSAAFNLLVITGICVISVPSPEPKRIKEFGVFCFTAVCSLWAYLWMMIVAVYISPHVVDIWEAWVTLLFCPLMVVIAYCQDSGWWCNRCKKTDNRIDTSKSKTEMEMKSSSIPAISMENEQLKDIEDEDLTTTPYHNVRVLGGIQSHGHAAPTGRELKDLENEHNKRRASRVSWNPHLALERAGSATSVRSGGSSSLISRLYENGHAGSRASISSSVVLREMNPENEEQRKALLRARFRHAAIRGMTGAKAPKRIKTAKIKQLEEAQKKIKITATEENLGKFAFSSANYSVLESGGHIDLDVIFYRKVPLPANIANDIVKNTADKNEEEADDGQGAIEDAVSVHFETREGTGQNEKDFKHTHGTLIFASGEYVKKIVVPIMDDCEYEADKDFYVILKKPEGGSAQLGDPSVARVTIIDDDEPGEFLFESGSFQGDEKTSVVTVNIIRQHGCDGTVTLDLSTTDGTARGGTNLKDDNADYKTVNETITFKNGEMQKAIDVKVNKKSDPKKSFVVTLKNPSIGARIGEHGGAICYVGKNPDALDSRLAAVVADDEEEEELTWRQQFKQAMTLETEEDEDGNPIEPGGLDFVLHFCTFFWKVLCAFIPPRQYLGAYPTFAISLLVIGAMTAVVEQLAGLLGCVVGLETAVTGITFVALGTSLPDTFASRSAALHDEYADNSIGNVTGSNSVNVFLGLGIPWVISTLYALAKGKQYCVTPNNLFQSIIFFTVCAVTCIIMLLIRRWVVGGELGGRTLTKWISGCFMISLWVIYIILASLKAYDILSWKPELPESVCTNVAATSAPITTAK